MPVFPLHGMRNYSPTLIHLISLSLIFLPANQASHPLPHLAFLLPPTRLHGPCSSAPTSSPSYPAAGAAEHGVYNFAAGPATLPLSALEKAQAEQCTRPASPSAARSGRSRWISCRAGTARDKAEVGMSVSVDGERVLHVRRLRWKFRGSEKVDLGGGDRVQVSWDLHNWLFPTRDQPPADATAALAAAPPPAHAVFVFRFEFGGGGEEVDSAEAKDKELLDKAGRDGGVWAGYLGKWGRGDWSESSSNGENRRKRGQARRLAKAGSSSSASVASPSASWASGSTVMDWASPEEAELQCGDGFSFLVYAWKS